MSNDEPVEGRNAASAVNFKCPADLKNRVASIAASTGMTHQETWVVVVRRGLSLGPVQREMTPEEKVEKALAELG